MGAARYKPYPSYKPSGVEWLRDIPEGWEIFNGKRLFGNRRETALPTDEQLAASQAFGVVLQSVMMARNNAKVMLATKGTASFRHVEKDDFVISLRSFEGGIEHSAYTGCVSPAYTVLQPLERLDPPYFRYLLKSTPFVSALQATTDSLRDGKSISYEQFGAIALSLPSLPEQTKIAAFLDYETAKIDALIAKQERLIALLEEKRQAVISHAVTKGLNADAPLRPSGIDWLGDVPEHWEVSKCGFYVSILSGFAFPSAGFSGKESGQRLLRGINVGVNEIKWEEIVYWKRFKNDGLDLFELSEGELVLGMDRPVISSGVRVAKVIDTDLPCLLLQRVVSISVKKKLAVDFLHFLLSSDMFVAHFAPETTGVSVPHISPSQISNFVIPVPPIDEQEDIVRFVSEMDEKFSSLVSKAQSAINLLKERRTALISAAVTGKIDLRDWQPPQPPSDTDLSTEISQDAAL